VLKLDGSLVLASTAPIDWADVFAPEDGEYERFGHHVAENRWAYDSKPAGADYLRNRIITATQASFQSASKVRKVRFHLPPTHTGSENLTTR
jgi:hypothetical protein